MVHKGGRTRILQSIYSDTTEKKRTTGHFMRVQHQDNFVQTVLLKNRFHVSKRVLNCKRKHIQMT